MNRVALAAVAAAAVAVAATGAAAAGTHPACPPPHAKVLAHDRAVSVWSRAGGPVAACDGRRGTTMTLAAGGGRPLPRVSLHGFELAGAVVAYVETSFGVDSGSSTLVIADVAAGRRLREAPAGRYVDAGLVFSEALEMVVVTSRGSAAWATSRSSGRVPGPSAIHLAARTGPVRLLDEGAGVEPSSLRVQGTTLSWSDGGVRHTHAMP